ncbi:endonuclease III [Candidatus Giovannonibacteria bacterium]|nr:endonuclease III [Candidatus Giovannonibacteria bacterium]
MIGTKFTKDDLACENDVQKRKRAADTFKRLSKIFPDAKIALNYDSPVQLAVAVILSAQCTDKKVNEVTASLFKKYKTVKHFASADQKIFEMEIKSTGFYRAKAKNIIAMAKLVESKFGGQFPKTMAEAVTLPGVARKSANVILGNAYGVVDGIAVDTHVMRISQRLGVTKFSDPVKIEKDLMKLFPKSWWFKFTYLIIEHGRNICEAKKPRCSICPLNNICPSAFNLPNWR